MTHLTSASQLRAPARINILGEHIDYVSYLPTASLTFGSREHAMVMSFHARADREIHGISTNGDYEPFVFTIEDQAPSACSTELEDAWLSHLSLQPAIAPQWASYVRGAVAYAQLKYGGRINCGFDFLVDSGIPACGGASSSSALTVLAGAAVRLVNQIAWDPEELARDSARAEWFSGTRGGAMDHLTICLARRDQAVYVRYADTACGHVALPLSNVRWVTFFSHPADKGRAVMLEYNNRVAVSQIIIPSLLSSTLDVDELPETKMLDEFAREQPEAMEKCRQVFPELTRESPSPELRVRDRARHHLGEVVRVKKALDLLRAASAGENDAAKYGLGELLNEAHISLRDLYEVSTNEVEHLRDIIIASPGVYGARLMGGGFGGNVLALVEVDAAAELIAHAQSEYYGPAGRQAMIEGAIMVSSAGHGLSLNDEPMV
jgi:galactokinase